MSSHRSTGSTSLRKGQACIYCRRRKMKCDGARPICGPCRRGQRPEDCEYTDRHGQSRMEALEESIARLSARIHELENPVAPSEEPVVLRQPYGESFTGTSSSRLRSTVLAVPSPGAMNAAGALAPLVEPPRDVILTFLNNFFEHALCLGFFLSAHDFQVSALLPYPLGDHRRPLSSLLAVVYFFGCFLSEDPAWQARSSDYLAKALESSNTSSLASQHPQKVLHTIQVEVLLANYLFSAGRLLEGRYHISTAMSLCVGSGLSTIRSPALLLEDGSSTGFFRKANSPLEVGERIMAWWVTLSLDQGWAAAFEVNSYNDPIIAETETPWPLPVEEYIRGRLISDSPRAALTVQGFLDGNDGEHSFTASPLELAAKAALLWKQSHLLKEASQVMDIAPLSAATRARTDELLLVLNARRGDGDTIYAPGFSLLLARGIAHAALISLICLRSSNSEGLEKVVNSSLSILGIIEKLDPRAIHINPLFTMLWTLASRSLIDILQRVPAIQGDQRNTLVIAIRDGLLAMDRFGSKSDLTKHQVHKIHEVLQNL
ncbi:hypothetical protein F5878DRAFT_268467 [Lentinula raphanica]|uniref:Zn(2)-C6 fungal-type domain-containing protein n=1 Tax=Lentinula raphanica TaxID=153919 RepID=A0AA38UL81_9AGAR|nr:hypothetical protein F5878DRAFT_268467 [Lentinula raphanica]